MSSDTGSMKAKNPFNTSISNYFFIPKISKKSPKSSKVKHFIVSFRSSVTSYSDNLDYLQSFSKLVKDVNF